MENLRKQTAESIKNFLAQNGEPGFRFRQIEEWLWKKSARSIDEMSNLSLGLREKLKHHFTMEAVRIAEMQISNDRTIKCAMELHDKKVVESVLIPTSERMTACISSQVGCSLTCKFCATGRLSRLRNLGSHEIYDQVALIKQLAEEKYKTPLTNIVYMGMGEPLLNYTEVMESIEKITSPEGLGMSPQRITVSTAGVEKMIRKLGDDGARFNLALSLHAANDKKRNYIMPINESNSLNNLAEALNYFYNKTGTRVTFEYIVFKDFNDGQEDAMELVEFCKKVPAKVNIIEYNPIDEGEFQQTLPERLERFTETLERNRVIVNVRRSRGKDIDAACGQLANKNKAVNTQSLKKT